MVKATIELKSLVGDVDYTWGKRMSRKMCVCVTMRDSLILKLTKVVFFSVLFQKVTSRVIFSISLD